MEIYTIYLITNKITNKVYVGFDSNWPNRIYTHRRSYKRKSKNCRLYSSMKSHGFENFEFTVIYQSKDKDHTLKIMEPYFIEYYKSFIGFEDCNGYNMTLGGEGTVGKSHSDEWKQKHSKDMKGRKFTEEHKLNISKALAGKKKSEEHRLNISSAHSGDNNWQKTRLGNKHPKSKKYIGISPTGEKYYIHGMRQFCREHDLNQGLAIQCAKQNPKYLTYKGWKFYYNTEEE